MKPIVDFGLGVVVGTLLGTGLAILFAPVPATTARWLLLPPDLAEQHQAGGSTPAAHSVAPRAATTSPPARQATQHATARDTVLAAAQRE